MAGLQIQGGRLSFRSAGIAALQALITGLALCMAHGGQLLLLDGDVPFERGAVQVGHGLVLGLAFLPAFLLAARARVGSRVSRRRALLALPVATAGAALFASVQASFVSILIREGELESAMVQLAVMLHLVGEDLLWEIATLSPWFLPPLVLLLTRHRGWGVTRQAIAVAITAAVAIVLGHVALSLFHNPEAFEHFRLTQDEVDTFCTPQRFVLAVGWAVLPPYLKTVDLLEARWSGQGPPPEVTTARLPSRWHRTVDAIGLKPLIAMTAGLALIAAGLRASEPPVPTPSPYVPRKASKLQLTLAEASTLTSEGFLHDALRRYEEALDLDPKRARTYMSRASVYRRLGDLDEALADMDRAVALEPDNQHHLTQRSFLKVQQKKHESALDDLLKVSELGKDSGHTCLWRSRLRATLGDTAGALEELRMAASLRPDDWWIQMEHGNLHKRLGEPDKALKAYQRALERHPRMSWVYQQRAEVHESLGDERAAALDRARGRRPERWTVFAPLGRS